MLGVGACGGVGSGGSKSGPVGSGDAGSSGSGTGADTGTGTSTGTGAITGTGTGTGTGAVTGTGAGSGFDTGAGAVTGTGSPGAGGSSGPGMGIMTGAAGAIGAGGVIGSAGAIGTGGSASGTPQSGQLTAGTWDDNLNFDFYLKYLTKVDGQQLAGRPIIPRANRLEIRVIDAAGVGVSGATVAVTGVSGKLLEAPTRSDGRLFFFPGANGSAAADESVQITATLAGATASVAAKVGDASVLISLDGATAAPPPALDLALVIDTTGSMADEIEYLKSEVSDIAARIAADFPNVSQRWALILYRDTGDEYVVRSFDFTASLATFQSNLAAQSAGGGGDYAESPDQALAKLTTLTFSQGNAARMAFWIADAPHHVGREATMVTDILTAQRLGIHLYPIAASGADKLVEYTMREAAEVTGGRYLFLTDDSGIGGSHEEPTIPCYFVTALSRAMTRMAAMELTGTNIDVAPADVIRTSGNPTAGHCTLADGQQVTVL